MCISYGCCFSASAFPVRFGDFTVDLSADLFAKVPYVGIESVVAPFLRPNSEHISKALTDTLLIGAVTSYVPDTCSISLDQANAYKATSCRS